MADEKSLTIAGQGTGPMGERGTITATLRDATANPGPLGLMAFGMTTILLNVHNAGLIPLSGMILAMGVFYRARTRDHRRLDLFANQVGAPTV